MVRQEVLYKQLQYLSTNNVRVISVSGAIGKSSQMAPAVVMTFDDGSESDALAAAPTLLEFGFSATFYVVAGNVGQCGYLSSRQLRKLVEDGMEIGSHSVTHRNLVALEPREILVEIRDSKCRLEQFIGRSVDHFSCPDGGWSPLIARGALEAGYRSVATSRAALNSAGSNAFKLNRIAIWRGTALPDFARLCRGEGLLARRMRDSALKMAKHMLGMHIYERTRRRLFQSVSQ